MFTHKDHGKITLLLVYVNDIIVTGNNVENIHHLTALLDQRFTLNNMGNLNYFLGFAIARGSKGIILSQRKYIIDLLSENAMLNCSLVSTPMNFFVKYHADGEVFPDPIAYPRLIGKLIYLTNTRPNIIDVFNHLSQYVSAPTKDHHQAVFRILRYQKGSIGQGIFLNAKSDIHLKSYSDLD